MKILKKTVIAFLAILAVYSAAGFLGVPPVIRILVSKNLSQTLHRTVTIEKVSFNPYTLVLDLKGFFISDRDQKSEFVSIKDIIIDLDMMSVFKRSLILSELRVDRPSIRFARFPDNTYSFSDLLKGDNKKKEPFFFSFANIQVNNGRVIMKDIPVNKTHTAQDIIIALPFISNMAFYSNVFVQPRFQAVINGTSFCLKGKTKPFSESLETSLTLNLQRINIPYYLSYLPSKRQFTVQSGWLNLDATGRYIQFRDKRKPELTLSGTVALTDLAIADLKGKPMIEVPKLSASFFPSEILKKKVHIRNLSLTSPAVTLVRDQKKVFNLQSAFVTEEHHRKQEKAKTGSAFILSLDELLLDGGKIHYSDLSGSSPVNLTIQEISSHAGNIHTDSDARGIFDLSCTVNETGNLKINSSLTTNPPSVDARFNVSGFEPSWVQPYIINRIPVLLRRGSLEAAGHVFLSASRDRNLDLNIEGDVQLVDLASVDSEHMQDLISWKKLAVSGIEFKLKQAQLSIREIGLTSPVVRMSIDQKGKSNITSLIAREPESKPDNGRKKKSSPFKVALGRVRMSNGKCIFIDRSVSPNFTAALTGIQGNITGLSTDEFKRAKVSVAAKIDNQAPVSVSGEINPLKKDLFVDLTARLANIEMTSASPYSGKYLGYAIEKGKFTLNLKCLIDQKQLDSDNSIFVDQFTFGDPVASETATKLPVKLAVILLRDKDGKIDLHLPVTGRTDDPQFKVGKIIWQMIVNIFEKAATAPFALLDALYPGAAELSDIEFDAGRSTLSDNGRQKLDKLIRILTDRPSLNVEAKGYTDSQIDRSGLVNVLFERKLKAQKLKDTLSHGRQTSSVDHIMIEPDEYSHYLKKAYKAEAFKKPSILGISRSLPDEEMKKLMVDHIAVNDDDLKLLASDRSQRIRDYLVEKGNISAERIFIVEAGSQHPEKINNVLNSRVGLTIK